MVGLNGDDVFAELFDHDALLLMGAKKGGRAGPADAPPALLMRL